LRAFARFIDVLHLERSRPSKQALPLRRLAVAFVAPIAAVGAFSSPAMAAPHCSRDFVTSSSYGTTTLKSTAHLSCKHAYGYLAGHDSDQHVPFKYHETTRVGVLRCHLVDDRTPPASDTDLIVGCRYRSVRIKYEFTQG
jgi:hypothetical protein